MQYVIEYKHKVTTTSLLVAEKFGKRHDNVLRDIQKLECSQKFRLLNFEESTYTVSGKRFPMIIMNRDGFTMLVMSFTGKSAATFREEFIDEFNRMEEILRQGETPVLIPTYQKRILSEPTKSVPEGYWSIFDEAHSIMLLVEKSIGSVNKYDIVDGSIGIHWAKYREGKEWAQCFDHYMHEYDDNRGNRQCKCYDFYELRYFKYWLKNIYKQMHLWDYLYSKYSREGNRVMLDKVNEVIPKLLKA